MKHAGRESRRHRALSSAWELKETEHYSRLMSHIHRGNRRKYEEYCTAVADGREEQSAVQGKEDVETLIAMNHELYNEYLASVSAADKQLDQLEEVLKTENASSDVSSDEGTVVIGTEEEVDLGNLRA